MAWRKPSTKRFVIYAKRLLESLNWTGMKDSRRLFGHTEPHININSIDPLSLMYEVEAVLPLELQIPSFCIAL